MINATRLWHGSQFLEGADVPSTHSIEDWLSQTNQQLTHLRTRFLLRLSDHSRASGQYEDALKYSFQAIESDNLNEDIHCRILRLLVDMEQYQEARQYYSYVTKLFSEELDSHSSLQLISVYRQIQKETLASIKSSQPDWRVLATIHTPFVGRQAELSQLQETLIHGGGMIVSGESGLGKTRLIQEFCELFASDRRIFVTPCRPAETNLPFQPIIEILRNQIHTTEWGAIQDIWAEPLTIILPELLSLHPSLNPPGTPYDPDQYRSTLFEAIRQVFMYIAQKKDLVIFLDDAHWADEATLSTVAYLIDRPPFDRNALAILATRSEEINPSLENFYLHITLHPN